MVLPGLKRVLLPVALACVAACAGEGASGEPGGRALALRPDVVDGGLPQPLFDPGSLVESHDSSAGHFRVHFVRTGVHAVPSRDADASGTPDYVEETADEYERVLAFFRGEGFRLPLSDEAVPDGNGGDGRFDVYLLNFPTGADGSYRSELCGEPPARGCAGYMLQENDFNGRGYTNLREATRILASHELFHAVQNAYVSDVSVVLAEATAAWASEYYDARLNDFEAFVPGYLSRPERSLLLEPAGPPDGFSYGAALFFRQLEETHDASVVRRLFDELAVSDPATARWAEALARVLSRDYQSSLLAAFTRFASWNLFTAGRADASRGYREGARYPLLTELAITLPFHDDLLRLLPLSAHYFVAPAASESVRAAVAPAAGLSEQRLLLARERAGRIAEVVEAPATQIATLTGLQAADRVHFVLVDGRATGNTLRLQVCLGEESALAPCSSGADAGVASEQSSDAGVRAGAGEVEAAGSDASSVRMEATAPSPLHDAGVSADADVGADTPLDALDSEDDPARDDAEPDAEEREPRERDAAQLEQDESAARVRARDAGCSVGQPASAHGPWWAAIPLICLLRRRRARFTSPRRSFA